MLQFQQYAVHRGRGGSGARMVADQQAQFAEELARADDRQDQGNDQHGWAPR